MVLKVVVAVLTPLLCHGGKTVTIAPGVEMPAISNGYIHQVGGVGVDTAYMYQNQPQFGKAIATMPREKVFITTKIHCTGTAEKALSMVKDDLKQLGVSYVDLVLVHGTGYVQPYAPGDPVGCLGWEPMSCCKTMKGIQATYHGLELALQQNLTRAIGVSNFQTLHLDAVLSSARVKPAVNQMRTFVGYHDDTTMAYARQHNITWMAYSPLGIYGQAKTCMTNPTVAEIAKTHNASTAQICLAWIVNLGGVLTTASDKESHDISDLASDSIVLSSAEMQRLGAEKNYWRSVDDPITV